MASLSWDTEGIYSTLFVCQHVQNYKLEQGKGISSAGSPWSYLARCV